MTAKPEITVETLIRWSKKHGFNVYSKAMFIEHRETIIEDGRFYASTQPGYKEIVSEAEFIEFFDPLKAKRLGLAEHDPESNSVGFPVVCYDRFTNKVIGEYPSVRRAAAVHHIPQTSLSASIAKNEAIEEFYFQYRK